VLLKKITDKLINASLLLAGLLKKVESLLNSRSVLYHQNLGDYLKSLFEENKILVSKSDFLEDVEDPYFSFAKILNLIPYSYKKSQQITEREVKIISDKFLSIKDKILLDGLYGKIDMHEHYTR